jgi:hypothetical protein
MQASKAERAKARAEQEFPQETWTHYVKGVFEGGRLFVGEHIFIAGSRQPKSNAQRQTIWKEIKQCHLLVGRGKTVYLVPEEGVLGQKHYDAIVDGRPTELKWVTGNRNAIGDNFSDALKKFTVDTQNTLRGNVFLLIDGEPIARDSLRRVLAGKIRKGTNYEGTVTCYVTASAETHVWALGSLQKK